MYIYKNIHIYKYIYIYNGQEYLANIILVKTFIVVNNLTNYIYTYIEREKERDREREKERKKERREEKRIETGRQDYCYRDRDGVRRCHL